MKSKIRIDEISEDIKILEQTPVLSILMRRFNKKINGNLQIGDFLSDLFMLERFDDFIRMESLCGTLPVSIDPKASVRAQELITDFKRRYGYIVTNSDRYYVDIRNKLYGESVNDPSKADQIKRDMRKFLAAYHMAKKLFEDTSREGIKPGETVPERYFNHLTGTTDIILNELPNPNINTLVMGILHDTIEDIKGIDVNVMTTIFGGYIAKGVDLVSKKDIEEYYLSPCQLEQLKGNDEELKKKIIREAKLVRQDDYFGHLDQLEDDYLTVKFADRIHNLRTLGTMPEDDIIKKIRETEKYFLPVAQRRNRTAYQLMLTEISKLKKALRYEFLGFKPSGTYKLANGMKAGPFELVEAIENRTDLVGGPENNIGMLIDGLYGWATLNDNRSSLVYGYWDMYTGKCLWRSFLDGEKEDDIIATIEDFDIK